MQADTKDVVGGSALVLTGLYMFYAATGYRIGTPQQMGPGYFPMMVSGLCVAMVMVPSPVLFPLASTIS